METARYAQRSDRTLNPQVRRRWDERSQPGPAPTCDAEAAEPALAALARERDEWHQRRAAEGRR